MVTRPDIMFATSLLCQFMHIIQAKLTLEAKRFLRYIQGTFDYGVSYEKIWKQSYIVFCDCDWASCVDDMWITYGYAFSLGSSVFSWASKKQQTVAQSFAGAKYVSASLATSHAI